MTTAGSTWRGSEAFIDKLESLADRPLRFRPIGRPSRREDREEAE